MYRISRIYIGNYGYKTCWYDGMLFDFIDEQTNEPTDFIIQLENGGGKSTLLAGIFSCFETSQNRFLKHLQENRNRFSEYFSPDGLPGFILVEWMIPAPGAQEYKRIVTGQVVSIKNKITNELERYFFSFETAPDLALESVPAPKLNPDPALQMDDFLRWLSRIKREYKGNVFDTRNHSDWEKHLQEERGIDIGMLKLQVEFSRMEGSIDTAFLNFRNEAEFIQKFLLLTMDAEQAEQVRKDVIIACDKLKKKPDFQKRLLVLQDLHTRLSEFDKVAADLETNKQLCLKTELVSAQIARTLSWAAANLQEEAAQAKILSEQLEGEVKQWYEQIQILQERNEGAQFISLKRKAHAFRDLFDSSKAALQLLKDESRYVNAAKLLANLYALRATYNETQAQATLAEEGLRPFMDQARVQGKILKELLLQHKLTAEANKKEAELLAQTQRDEREKLKVRSESLSKEIAAKNRELARLQEEQSRHQLAMSHWRQQGILNNESESLAIALERAAETLASERHLLEKCEQQQESCEQSIKQLGADISKQTAEKATKIESIKAFRKEIAEAEGVKDALAQNRALCRAAETEIVDPDSESLLATVDKYISELQRTRDANSVILASLNQDRSEIESTGLSASNPEVQTVLAALAEHGVKTAVAFNYYIAQTEPDAKSAREIVCSNPSRFLGVAIKTERELQQALKILANPPAISKPVFVSLIANQPEQDHTGFVIPAENDAAFNFDSARRYAQELSQRMQQQIRLVDEYKSMYDEAVEAKSKLKQYTDRYGHGRLNNRKQELIAMEAEAAELSRLLAEKNDQLKEQEQQLKQLRSDFKILTQKIKDSEKTLALIQKDHDELEVPSEQRRARLQLLLKTLEQLHADLEQTERTSEAAYQLSVDAEANAREHVRNADAYQKEISEIRHCDDEFDAQASLRTKPVPLAAARDLYKSAAHMLDYEERNRLGVLKKELESVEQNLSEKQQEYSAQFGDLDEQRAGELIALDLDAELVRLKAAVEESEKQFEEHKSNLTIADNDLKQFKKKYSAAEQRSQEFAEISDQQLAEELLAIPQTIESFRSDIESNKLRINQLIEKSKSDNAKAELYDATASQLSASVDLTEDLEPDASLIPGEISEVKSMVTKQIREIKNVRRHVDDSRTKADRAFQNVQKAVFSDELTTSEPEISMLLANHQFESACDSAAQLTSAVSDRIQVAQDWLDSVKAEFDATVEELLALVSEGIRIIQQSTNKRIPESAPYLGGKPVIKMKTNLHAIPVDQRRRVLSDFMDGIISTGMAHKNGTDMVADAIQKVAGRSLGLFIAKLTREESEQYASADKLSNSGGEAVSMALFLYILTAQIRAENQAEIRRHPGGPLILDNPFAKASSPFIWRAQRSFARAMGVQLIFASATKDLDTLGEFEHFVYLRKAGVNNKTGRYHIEQVDLNLNRVS